MSCVTCHVSHVTCHMSCVTCNYYYFIFFGQSCEAYRWRVCYQRGLPRLVIDHIPCRASYFTDIFSFLPCVKVFLTRRICKAMCQVTDKLSCVISAIIYSARPCTDHEQTPPFRWPPHRHRICQKVYTGKVFHVNFFTRKSVNYDKCLIATNSEKYEQTIK